MSLTVRSTEKIPGVFVLYPEGRLDSDTYTILEKKIEYLFRVGEASHMTFDMTGLNYISSMGIRVLMKAQKDLKKRGGAISMMNLQPQIVKVFEIIKALPSMRVYSSMEEFDEYLTSMQEQTLKGTP